MASNTATTPQHGILSDDMKDDREQLVELLTRAYWMEVETVMSYLANSINPEGVRAQEIIESLEKDIEEELGHARKYGQRIKELYGVVPGSLDFQAEQNYLQPPDDQVDIVHVIQGVIEAETGAIEHYNRIIEFAEGRDPVTQDMVIQILSDEEGHRRLFEGFLREYKAENLAQPTLASATSTIVPNRPAAAAITPTTVGDGPPWMPVACTAAWPLPRCSSQRLTG